MLSKLYCVVVVRSDPQDDVAHIGNFGNFVEGVFFCGGELWVSGKKGHGRFVDVDVDIKEISGRWCPCCLIFETSTTSKKFRANGVHAVAFPKHRREKFVGYPQCICLLRSLFFIFRIK